MSNKDKKEPRKNTLGAAPEKPVIKDNKGSRIAQNTSARLAAVQVIYQMKGNDESASSAVEDFITNRIGFELEGDVFVPANKELLREIAIGFEDRADDVKGIVVEALAKGGKKDVEPLLEAILYAGVYELLANPKVDVGIIINDYINVTDSFYGGSETKIINAILDGVAKKIRD